MRVTGGHHHTCQEEGRTGIVRDGMMGLCKHDGKSMCRQRACTGGAVMHKEVL